MEASVCVVVTRVTTPLSSRAASKETVNKRTMLSLLVTALLLHVPRAKGERCQTRVVYESAGAAVKLITSPSHPNDYENQEHCQWVVTASNPSHVVQLESVVTDLVNWDQGDCEDYMAVYDGPDTDKPLLRKWCAPDSVVITSSGKSLLIVFHTDQHLTGKGFALKYYSLEKFSSVCDPENVVILKTSLNPLIIDLPNYATPRNASARQVRCRYLFTASQNDASQVIRLDAFSHISCYDGNMTIYDGGSESSRPVLSWCHESPPFSLLSSSGREVLLVLTLDRPDRPWHGLLRLRVMARSAATGCDDKNVPTIQVTSLPALVSLPYSTSIQGDVACAVRFWAEGRYQTLRLELVNSSRADWPCADAGLDFYDGYSSTKYPLLSRACEATVVHSSTHLLYVSPGKEFPLHRFALLKVSALDYPCNKAVERKRAYNDRVQVLPSLSNNNTGYPNDAHCMYVLSAEHVTDAVQVEVEGRMVGRGAADCEGDYIIFRDGELQTDKELQRWCGDSSRRVTVTSEGRHLMLEVISDSYDNLYEGFTASYYSVPANERCPRQRLELAVNSTVQRLTSPNYPFYYPINSYCEWLLRAPQGQQIVLKVIKSEMEGDCSDVVRVYDGEQKSSQNALGRWCASETPQYLSTGPHLLLIFTANDRWNTGGFEAEFYLKVTDVVQASVWAIIGGLLAAVIIIIILIIAIVLYVRHWRREQRKI